MRYRRVWNSCKGLIMLNYLCTLSLKFNKKCYLTVQLSKSKKKLDKSSCI